MDKKEVKQINTNALAYLGDAVYEVAIRKPNSSGYSTYKVAGTSKTISGLIWVYVAFGLFIASFVLLAKNTVDLMGEEAVEAADSILELFGAPSLKTIFLYLLDITVIGNTKTKVQTALVHCSYVHDAGV